MMQLENLNIASHEVLVTPEALKTKLPVSEAVSGQIASARQAVNAILSGDDPRLLVVVGPCSIHDVTAGREYAERLRGLADRVSDSLLLVMRAYFEKPRTTVGWKGLINDPHLDDTFRVAEGLEIARRFLLDLAELGLPLSTEALDPITPQYLQDLITWSAIGARTTESQTHREMASGLSSAVGFKNGTDGGFSVALNALQSVSKPHRFLGINPSGQVAVLTTRGNPNAHIVLRGGSSGPNYDAHCIARCEEEHAKLGLTPNIMVDCSHANSSKDPERQPEVAREVARQILQGNHSLMGLMIESHLHAGNQKLAGPREELTYGVSVTDGCIGWETTESLLLELSDSLGRTLAQRRRGALARAG
jgi:3-deoxy-7-phosphoheptulonate synthase